ncbi:MAG: metallophosphoesterase [Clostridia bacterium]|nr:metallophosphoesterase [Clostridia bacterium]
MNVYAISDLHLPGGQDKPMTKFGADWTDHFNRIKADWLEKVKPEDIVLLCGDFSWGMELKDIHEDLMGLAGLPGEKVFIRGNHDYWWHGITKVRNAAPDSTFHFLQNDCIRIGTIVICGSRGWTCPGSPDYTDQDEKLYLREAERFNLCFKEVHKVMQPGDTLIVCIHFPPFSLKNPGTLFTRTFEEEGAKKVVFGHLHGDAYFPMRQQRDGTEYILTSCDKLGFRLARIL